MTTTRDTRPATAVELVDSIWVASALATALGRPGLVDEDPAGQVLAAAGLVRRSDAGWVLTEPLGPEARPERIAMVREQLISALGQPATIAVRGERVLGAHRDDHRLGGDSLGIEVRLQS